MLELRDLACLRGDRLLFAGLDAAIGAGSLVRVTGPNGIGKTSLLRMVCGMVTPEAGEVRWRGAPIATVREDYHRRLLYLGHAAALNDLLTPLENLRFACRAGGDAVRDADCEAALERIGLAAQLDLPCRVLSQGQRRRVGLARLFLSTHRPLWVLDEPFNALDVAAVADLAAAIDAHCTAGGRVLVTTHQDIAFATPVDVLDLTAVAC